jgi:hypothetical protein
MTLRKTRLTNPATTISYRKTSSVSLVSQALAERLVPKSSKRPLHKLARDRTQPTSRACSGTAVAKSAIAESSAPDGHNEHDVPRSKKQCIHEPRHRPAASLADSAEGEKDPKNIKAPREPQARYVANGSPSQARTDWCESVDGNLSHEHCRVVAHGELLA